MAFGHTRWTRVRVPASFALIIVMLLVGCGGSSGVHTETPSPVTSSSVSSLSPTSSSASSTPESTFHTSRPSVTKVPTPSVTAPAQDAVDAYVAFYNDSGIADRDPAHADIAALDRYLTGKARTLFDTNYASMKRSGRAYRGTAPDPRIRVQQIFSATSIFLTSCPLESKSDPYIEYTVSSGKPVSGEVKANPPSPYLLILPMVKVGSQWKLADVIPNTGKTCTG